jgi:hypothetical protein
MIESLKPFDGVLHNKKVLMAVSSAVGATIIYAAAASYLSDEKKVESLLNNISDIKLFLADPRSQEDRVNSEIQRIQRLQDSRNTSINHLDRH